MEGKKRVVPGETWAERSERGNRGHIRKDTLNAQESAEAIVPAICSMRKSGSTSRAKKS